MLNFITENFEINLENLKKELQSYRDESKLWVTGGEVNNCPGNLALHLVGNLNHFIGHHLGQTGFVRNRPAEFDTKNVPVNEIVKEIDATALMIRKALSNMNPEDLEKTYPQEPFGRPMTTGFFLIHLFGHLRYHTGQISYHRRLIDLQS